MNKRTEALIISVILTGAAIVAALTSNIGVDQAHAEESSALAADATAPVATTETSDEAPAGERSLTPVVYDMDIPADVMSDYEAAPPQTADPLPTEDQVATERSSEEDVPIA